MMIRVMPVLNSGQWPNPEASVARWRLLVDWPAGQAADTFTQDLDLP